MLLSGRGLSVLLLSTAALCWAGNNVVAKAIIADVPPFSFTFLRWLLATLVLLPFCWRHVKRDWRKACKSWVRLLLIATLGICAFNTLLYMAVVTTTALNVGVISSIFPAAIALFSWLILNIRLTRLQVAGMLVSFIGIILVITRGEPGTLADFVFVEGDIWMLIGIVCGALYPVLLHDKPDIHPLGLLMIIILLGMLVSLPLYLVDLAQHRYVHLNAEVGAGLLYIAIFPSILAYLFWNRGIELIGANRAGLYLNLIPILTAAMAAFFLGEKLAWYHFAGLVIVICGMLLFNLPQLRSDGS